MLEAYFKKDEPFIVTVEDKEFILRNLNSIPIEEIDEIVTMMAKGTTTSRILAKVTTQGNYKKVSPQQQLLIREAWEEHSGITLDEAVQSLVVLNNYSTSITSDLGRLTNFRSIKELIQEDLFTICRTIQAIILRNWRSSDVVAEINSWLERYEPDYQIESLLYRIEHLTVAVNRTKNSPPYVSNFPAPKVKETDTLLEDFEPAENEGTQEENDALITQWQNQ